MKRGMVKIGFSVLIILLLAAILVPVGCASPTPEKAPAPKPAPAPEKTMTLKFYTHEPAPPPKVEDQPGTARTFIWFTGEIGKRTEGRVKVEIFWGETLGKANDALKIVGGGVAQMGMFSTANYPWDVPLTAGGPTLPFLTQGVRQAPRATRALYNEWPAMEAEWTKWNVKVLFFGCPGTYWLWMKWDKPINKLDDLKGAKVKSQYEYPKIFDAFGLINVNMSSAEVYEAISKGVLNGSLMPFSPTRSWGFHEVAKKAIDFTFAGGQSNVPIGVNIDTWNQISPKDQKIILDLAAEGTDYFAKTVEESEKLTAEFFKSQGVQFIYFSPEEQARIKNTTAEKIWATWLQTAKDRGVPGDEFMARYKPIVEKVIKEVGK